MKNIIKWHHLQMKPGLMSQGKMIYSTRVCSENKKRLSSFLFVISLYWLYTQPSLEYLPPFCFVIFPIAFTFNTELQTNFHTHPRFLRSVTSFFCYSPSRLTPVLYGLLIRRHFLVLFNFLTPCFQFNLVFMLCVCVCASAYWMVMTFTPFLLWVSRIFFA